MDIGFTLTGDGRGVLYLAGDARIYERFGLFLAPFAADGRVKRVSRATVENGGVHSFRISADGKRVLYLANQDSLTATELYFSDLVRPLAPARR